MATLTKRDIVLQISSETGLVQHSVLEIVQKTLDIITESVAKGDTVELRNFGVLEVKLTRPRVGRNPNQPGSRLVIPSRAAVKFKPGKVMRERVEQLTDTLKRNSPRDVAEGETDDDFAEVTA
jgi:nucleoid DNA-binding protein